MKSFLTIFLCCMLAVACNSTTSQTKEACLSIYKEGKAKIQQAKSQKEIGDISYEVAKKLSDIGNGPEGDKKLSGTDQMELFKAQTEFYQAIEQRARQLLSSTPQQQEKTPILRNLANPK